MSKTRRQLITETYVNLIKVGFAQRTAYRMALRRVRGRMV